VAISAALPLEAAPLGFNNEAHNVPAYQIQQNRTIRGGVIASLESA